MKAAQKVWLFLAQEQDGTEGLVATFSGHGWMPLVTTSEKNLPAMREAAGRIAHETGRAVHLVEFTRSEVQAVFARAKG